MLQIKTKARYITSLQIAQVNVLKSTYYPVFFSFYSMATNAGSWKIISFPQKGWPI